jgi:hypothetical protein
MTSPTIINPPMKKTVYVNGIVVGEVEGTGDVQQDIELIRDFLKAKGLHREVTMVQAMFRQALSFCKTASELWERDLKGRPSFGLAIAPFVVNAAFSLELYLKTLHQLVGTTIKGHSLLILYDALSDDARNAVVGVAQEISPVFNLEAPTADAYRAFVADLDNAFVEWRYCYEKGAPPLINVHPALLLMASLDQACRRLGVT